MRAETDNSGTSTEYVTAMIGGQLFGLPIGRVQDVFMPDRMTQVPLASSDIAGILNLRGRIVTVIDMCCRLGVPPQERGQPMAIGIECRGESYGLLIDRIGEVITLPDSMRETNPVNLDERLALVSAGVMRLDSQLMVILDIDRVLHVSAQIKAA
jgi:purine-binding chemotaxis protein CheW